MGGVDAGAPAAQRQHRARSRSTSIDSSEASTISFCAYQSTGLGEVAACCVESSSRAGVRLRLESPNEAGWQHHVRQRSTLASALAAQRSRQRFQRSRQGLQRSRQGFQPRAEQHVQHMQQVPDDIFGSGWQRV